MDSRRDFQETRNLRGYRTKIKDVKLIHCRTRRGDPNTNVFVLFILSLKIFQHSRKSEKMNYPILTPIPVHYRRALIFDVETTGLIPRPNPANDTPPRLDECPYILQLSFVVYQFSTNRILESHDAYISIPEEIPIVERITEITGITREIIREKGTPIVDSLRAFYEAYSKCDIVIAHNIEFDSGMIAIEIARNAEFLDTKIATPLFTPESGVDLYCTMKATIELCSIMTEYSSKTGTGKPRIYKKFPKLSELHERLFGSIPENLHNSLIDVLVCLRCFLKIRCCINMTDTMFDRMLRNVVKNLQKEKDSKLVIVDV
jgi:DNA polymerase-3 subunit epsilon